MSVSSPALFPENGKRCWRTAFLEILSPGLLLCAGTLLVSSATGSESSREDATNHFARAPYLQMATPTSIVVVWRTHAESHPVLRYGRSVASLDQQIDGAAIVTRVALTTNKTELKKLEAEKPELFRLPKLHSAPAGLFQYEAHVTGLSPNTKYFYAVYEGQQRLTEAAESYHFVTQPPTGTTHPMRFWVVGDSGTGREAQHNVQAAMNTWTGQEKRPIDFYLHLGDMAYLRGRDVEFQARFFEMYEPTLRNKVCWPTMGNHEGATSKGTNGIGPMHDAYVVPTRAEAGGWLRDRGLLLVRLRQRALHRARLARFAAHADRRDADLDEERSGGDQPGLGDRVLAPPAVHEGHA
jgi:hypothetical protein